MRPGYRFFTNTIALPLIFSATVLAGANANATNARFLKDSILSAFGQEDLADFKEFIASALDSTADQKEVTWISKTSDLKGKYKARFTYKTNDTICRRSLFLLGQGEKRETYKFDICKIDGKWEIKEPPAKHFTDKDWQLLEQSAEQALNTDETGQPFSWRNAKTGRSGVNVATSKYRKNSKDCRDLAITIFDKSGNSSNGNFNFCKDSKDKWQRDANK